MFIFESFQILSFSPSKNSNLSSLPRVRALFVSHSLFKFSHTFCQPAFHAMAHVFLCVTGSRVQIKEKGRWKGIGLGWGWDIGSGKGNGQTSGSYSHLIPTAGTNTMLPNGIFCLSVCLSVCVWPSVWEWERARCTKARHAIIEIKRCKVPIRDLSANRGSWNHTNPIGRSCYHKKFYALSLFSLDHDMRYSNDFEIIMSLLSV